VSELDELQPTDPRQIGPYWLVGRLGSGGMGRVYLGRSARSPPMNNSLDADNDYHAWMADLVSSGSTCGSNPNQDSNYVAGGNASAAATTSKDAFLAIWNPMAPRYGQQTYSDTGF
jgi:hypothetical protein